MSVQASTYLFINILRYIIIFSKSHFIRVFLQVGCSVTGDFLISQTGIQFIHSVSRSHLG